MKEQDAYWCWKCMDSEVSKPLKTCYRCNQREARRRYYTLNAERAEREWNLLYQRRLVPLYHAEIWQRKQTGRVEKKKGCE